MEKFLLRTQVRKCNLLIKMYGILNLTCRINMYPIHRRSKLRKILKKERCSTNPVFPTLCFIPYKRGSIISSIEAGRRIKPLLHLSPVLINKHKILPCKHKTEIVSDERHMYFRGYQISGRKQTP